MAQKRCIHGRFKLRPDGRLNQIFLYALGYTSEKFDILLHEFMVMSNHDHPLYTDPEANGPAFLQQLHSLVARAVNALYGESDSLWSGQRVSTVRLLDVETVLRKCAYVLLNPVEAGLVRYAWDWPGVTSWGLEYGKPLKVKRPEGFFSEDMPDEVEVVIHRPEGLYPDADDTEARRRLRAHVEELQSELVAKKRHEGHTFLGAGRVMRQPRDNKADIPRAKIRPHIASKDPKQRVNAILELVRFWEDHRKARLAYKDDQRDQREVEFPLGTWWMARVCGVRVRPPP